MKRSSVLWIIVLLVTSMSVGTLLPAASLQAQTPGMAAKPAEIQIAGPIPARILLQSPADTLTELQIICLFQSAPENALHGALTETNEKLKGLLDQIRQPGLFRGDLGETILIEPPAGTLKAKKLLLIGLGDAQTFTPQRLDLVGSVAYGESNRLGVAHPFFAPTILDGGVTKFTTGQASENFVTGFLRAARTEKILRNQGAAQAPVVQNLTYLAGPAHAADTRQGIERAFTAAK